MYESGTASAFTDDRMGAASLWMVSVLRVGADDARAAREMAITAERMMTSSCLVIVCGGVVCICLPETGYISTRQEGQMEDAEIEVVCSFEEEIGACL